MKEVNYKQIDKHELYYELYSEPSRDATLVLLHDGLGSVNQWKDIPLWLFENSNFNILVYDRCGYGYSSKVNGDYPLDYLRYEAGVILPQLLNSIGISKCSLLGHSDGATLALLFASFFPVMTQKVVSIAAHVIIEEVSLKGISEIKKIYSSKLQKPLQKYHEDKTDWVFFHWADTWLHPRFREWNMLEELKKIKSPVFAIQGKDDEYGSIEQLSLIASSCNTKTAHIENCGHHPHFQKRELVLDLIIRFLNEPA